MKIPLGGPRMNRPAAGLALALAIAWSATPVAARGPIASHPAARLSVPSGRAIVTRPAPPLHQRFDGAAPQHGHHHGPTVFFVTPHYFAPGPFFYPDYGYPYHYSSFYDSPFYAYTPPHAYRAAPTEIDAPFYCWIDQLSFTSEERFAHHLHEVHGVPLAAALGSSEVVGGRYVFFGY
jgi:hypothetical protein